MHGTFIQDAHRSPSSALVVADKMLPRVARLRHHPLGAVEPAPSQRRRQGVAGRGAERRAALGLFHTAPKGPPMALGHEEYRQGEEAQEKGAWTPAACSLGFVLDCCAIPCGPDCSARIVAGDECFAGFSVRNKCITWWF